MTSLRARHGRWALLWAACALTASQAADAATPVASASTTLSNLSFRLIDLAPNDGIAPSATFTGNAHFYSAFIKDDQGIAPTYHFTPPLPGWPLPSYTKQDPHYAVAIGGSTIKSSAAINAGEVVPSSYDGQLTSQVSSELVFALGDDQARYQNPQFVPFSTYTIQLGANTGIVFEGDTSFDFMGSSDNLRIAHEAAVAQFGSPSVTYQAWVNSSAYLSINLFSGSYSDSLRQSFVDEAELGVGLCAECATGTANTFSSKSNHFSLSYSNVGPQARDVSLLIENTNLAIQAIVLERPRVIPEPPVIPAIPEPGTWALMGLGLLSLGWARKRHQA